MLRRIFEAHLSAVGGKNITTIAQEINAEIERDVALPNRPKAKRILGLYLEYKRELLDLERRPGLSGQGVQAMRNRMLTTQDLRTHYFTAAEIQALFGFEDALNTAAIARLEINQNPQLTPEQRETQLTALDAAMPENMRRARDATPVPLEVEEKVYAMRVKGASDDEVYRLRAKEFDPQAAAQLAASDRDEAQWKTRIAQYLAERNQLLETPEAAADPDHQAALLNLRRTRFAEDERSRLPAYEQ